MVISIPDPLHIPYQNWLCSAPLDLLSGKQLPWTKDPKRFERWAAGKTGLPLVDANMRELAATGTHTHAHTCTRTHIHTHTHIHIQHHTHIHSHTYTHARTHAQKHAKTHAHT